MDVYVYRQTEPGVWTVGFYDPQGRWHPESDHASAESAAERVHWLNGGNRTAWTDLAEALRAERPWEASDHA